MIDKRYLQIYDGVQTDQPLSLTCTKLNSQMLIGYKIQYND